VIDAPEMRFTRFGKDRIAYQVIGEGPPDLLYLDTGGATEAIMGIPAMCRLLPPARLFLPADHVRPPRPGGIGRGLA
jgi:hypothetical protein